MEFVTPGQEGGLQPSSSQRKADGSVNANNMTQFMPDFGATVSLSSSGNSGSLSQASGGSNGIAAALPHGLSGQQQLQQQQKMQQHPQGMPNFFNPLQFSGLPSALGPVLNMGNNNTGAATTAGSTIGVPLTSEAVEAGLKRNSEDDLFTANRDARSLDTSYENTSLSGKGPPVKDEAELEKMTPAERRRYERNLREQQRSYRISQQIKTLRDVLEESKIPFKPNKFSILVSVVEYIKQLQTRAIMLDAEHQKLIDTIRQTNEMASLGQIPSSIDSSSDSVDAITSGGGTDSSEDAFAATMDLNFQTVFQCSPSGMAVCSLDGRILTCNESFETSLSLKKDEILQQSMFIYIRNHQDIFEAMADLLKRSSVASEAGEGVVRASHLLFWCGHVVSLQNRRSSLTITLSSTADGNPKYFTLTVSRLP
jgi:PAS domain-containing protein